MIPKVIHYCWFGGNPFPELAEKCIASWRKFFSEYEIKEWNESNFDVNCCEYVREAYREKKWAFVSDYARYWILFNYGGIYFDTDVEVIKSLEDIVEAGSFMGTEKDFDAQRVSGDYVAVNSGLGMGIEKGNEVIGELLKEYESVHFIQNTGSYDLSNTVVLRTTNRFISYGFDNKAHTVQTVKGITIYPKDYFAPMNYYTGEISITENTRTIHHYLATWLNPREKQIMEIKKKYDGNALKRLTGNILCVPIILINEVETVGLMQTIQQIGRKIAGKS